MLARPLRLLAIAIPLAMAAPASATPVQATYEVQAGGMTIMRVVALFDLDAPGGGYRVDSRMQLTGMAGMLGSGEQTTSAEGVWRGLQPVPQRYRTDGTWRGIPRRTVIDYAPNGAPVLHALVPPNDHDREVVPEALRRGTMDTLSALAKLTRVVAQTGRCDLEAATFDGRRRADYLVRTAALERLPTAGGPATDALRCTFESRLLAGRRADQSPEDARRPQIATAWIAPAGPGGSPLPVRIELPSRWLGTIRVRLVGAEAAGPGSGRQQFVEQRR